MTDPITFPSTSPRFSLPFLFAGQAQKEFFVNESLQKIDMLLHPCVETMRDSPPTDPNSGECWLIGDQPSAAWAGRSAHIACWSGEHWIYAAPREGMTAYDRGAGQLIRYIAGTWQRGSDVNPPSGGTTIDTELRAEFTNLLNQLRLTGVIA